MAKLNISQSAKVVGKSRPIVYKKIKAGELTVEQGLDGEKLIDTSELIRVFGDLVTSDKVSRNVNSLQYSTPEDTTGLHQKISYLEMENQRLLEQIEREREDKDTLLSDLRADRDEWREQAKKQTLLLTVAQEQAQLPVPSQKPTTIGFWQWLTGRKTA